MRLDSVKKTSLLTPPIHTGLGLCENSKANARHTTQETFSPTAVNIADESKMLTCPVSVQLSLKITFAASVF